MDTSQNLREDTITAIRSFISMKSTPEELGEDLTIILNKYLISIEKELIKIRALNKGLSVLLKEPPAVKITVIEGIDLTSETQFKVTNMGEDLVHISLYTPKRLEFPPEAEPRLLGMIRGIGSSVFDRLVQLTKLYSMYPTEFEKDPDTIEPIISKSDKELLNQMGIKENKYNFIRY